MNVTDESIIGLTRAQMEMKLLLENTEKYANIYFLTPYFGRVC